MVTVADLQAAELRVEEARVRVDQQLRRIEKLRAKCLDTRDARANLDRVLRLMEQLERQLEEIAEKLARGPNSD